MGNNAGIKTGAYDELRPGGYGLVYLNGGQHRPRSQQQPGYFAVNVTDRLFPGGGTKGNFRAGKPSRQQRPGQGNGLAGIVNFNNRHYADFSDLLKKFIHGVQYNTVRSLGKAPESSNKFVTIEQNSAYFTDEKTGVTVICG
jgi:hypothetical protein